MWGLFENISKLRSSIVYQIIKIQILMPFHELNFNMIIVLLVIPPHIEHLSNIYNEVLKKWIVAENEE